MQNKEIYEYAIIRFVPKVEREEFINIGVIVLCKRKKYLQLRYEIDEERLTAFSQDADVEMIGNYLKGWELMTKGGTAGGRIGEMDIHVRFRWLTADRSTIIQSSKVHPGIGFAGDETIDRIFAKYVS
ncbi:DUF3037 domain-containing protein [Saprospiraceae bacterium]|nr:DUF3037 domain-containing protein [Saprospiraceae bacterium]